MIKVIQEFVCISQEIKEKMHEATFHHVKCHAHHPEYWDDSLIERVWL